ncbi:MAG TPA: Stk1 family PASTA domain-containing Ser/Thr kinase [Pseudolysinimonas sp.]|nr:Stk1 family PASTA domain-containing Ser/Thr kinase [Pseudolysinimonas sp.]
MSVGTSDPMIGRLVDGRYEVRSRIARGGMATVYLAKDQRLDRRVAIKVMHSHLADDATFTQRFIQEARSAARLAHPNVVNVFDQGQDAESAYLVMEYLPGITLRELLQEYGSLTAEQTLDITEAVLSGLAAAHKAGIVHRDLKPENVLLADDGRIKIGDFGLARAATANTATGAALLGTVAYLSPELVTRGVADTRSDIYAVGIMMYEMLTGEQPFTGEQPMQIAYQHANDAVPAPSIRNPRVPAELDELVLWATARDPEQRPRDARAMLDQLHETEALLRTALPATTTARTAVLSPAPDLPTTRLPSPASDAETQILGPRTRPRSTTRDDVPDSTAALAIASRRRRGRGWVLVAVIAVLALLAGGTGWWFGLGPGSRVTIPDSIAGSTPAEAEAALTDLGFVVADENGTIDSPKIPKDAVAQTDPAIGESVAKGSTVQLLISTGPKPLPFGITAGMPVDEAEKAIADAPWTPTDPITQFDAKIEKDTVVDVLAADGTTSLLASKASTYGELQKLTLVVSAGPVPKVAGENLDDAITILGGVELTATKGSETFSDTIPEGKVIKIELEKGQVLHPGDKVTLQLSRGPAPVDVPDIIGMTWTQAKAALDAAGLKYDYNRGADSAPDLVTVRSADPDPGTEVHRGDTIKVRFTV